MQITKVRDVKSPERGTPKSAGLDFFVPNTFPITLLFPGCQVIIPSGIHVKVPEGYTFIGFNKSGIATKLELSVGACVIDEDYQGEIHLNLYNRGTDTVTIKPGMKIAQFILVPVLYANIEEVSSIDKLYAGTSSERGTGAFGSTNKE